MTLCSIMKWVVVLPFLYLPWHVNMPIGMTFSLLLVRRLWELLLNELVLAVCISVGLNFGWQWTPYSIIKWRMCSVPCTR